VGVYDVAAQKVIKLADDRGQWFVPFLPDSKRVIYVTFGNELVIVDIATRQRRVIPLAFGTGVNAESFAVAPDGKALYFGAWRVEANVWKVAAR
jgi:DNA-binding beta-propeller fold protein YncE